MRTEPGCWRARPPHYPRGRALPRCRLLVATWGAAVVAHRRLKPAASRVTGCAVPAPPTGWQCGKRPARRGRAGGKKRFERQVESAATAVRTLVKECKAAGLRLRWPVRLRRCKPVRPSADDKVGRMHPAAQHALHRRQAPARTQAVQARGAPAVDQQALGCRPQGAQCPNWQPRQVAKGPAATTGGSPTVGKLATDARWRPAGRCALAPDAGPETTSCRPAPCHAAG